MTTSPADYHRFKVSNEVVKLTSISIQTGNFGFIRYVSIIFIIQPDLMLLSVNPSQRYAKMRAHTATHLLHAQLGKIFPQTKQAGSLVDEDYARFDFYADRLLSFTEIATIEGNINKVIGSAFPVSIQESSKSDAEKLGAKMFFEDKYGDVVRVVSIIDIEDATSNPSLNSVEFCGGTHVANTKDIGAFVIIGQQAVASGIKRIIATTGPKVIELIYEKNKVLVSLADKLECMPAQLEEKVTKLISDYQLLQSEVESNNKALLESAVYEDRTISGIEYDFLELGKGAYKNISTKDAQGLVKKGFEKNTLITDANQGFVIYSPKNEAKKLMTEFGRKGGGNDMICQGKITR